VQKAATPEYHLTCLNGSILLVVTLSIIPNPGYGQQVPPTNPTAQVSQQPGPYSPQVNSQILVLDGVVNNKKGEPMANLTRDDFKVYEAQQIKPFGRMGMPYYSIRFGQSV